MMIIVDVDSLEFTLFVNIFFFHLYTHTAQRVLFLSKWHVANDVSGCDKYYFSFPTGYISLAL